MNTKVSIIIRTKNEARWIKQCLSAIFSQNYKKLETELGDIDTARVRTISFEDSNYSSMLNYSVTLEGPAPVKVGASTYSTQSVKGVVDEFSFSESATGFSSLTHRVAAQGIDDRRKGSTDNSDALKKR